MSFATELQTLKNAIIVFNNKIKDKFDEYISLALRDATDGVAPLDSNRLIPVANLPRITNVDTADKLTTIRSIGISGDATWSIYVNGYRLDFTCVGNNGNGLYFADYNHYSNIFSPGSRYDVSF